MENGIILCSTLHDPKAGFLGTFKPATRVVKESGYVRWVINVTSATDPRVKHELQSLSDNGVILIETQNDREHRLAESIVADDHFRVIQRAVEVAEELGLQKILYCDGDRINMAAREYPEDFLKMTRDSVALITTKGTYLNYMRPRQDHLGHQTPLWVTEAVFNRLYSEALGLPIDIGSTAHGMSLDVAKNVVKEGPKMGVEYPHPSFMIAAKETGATIKSIEAPNVLSTETPEQLRPDIEAEFGKHFSSYEDLRRAWKATGAMRELHDSVSWERRFKVEKQYLEVLADHLRNFGLDKEKEKEIRQKVERAVEGIDVKKEKVARYLESSVNKLEGRSEKARNWVK